MSFKGNAWFTFEIILRFIVAPSKKAFCLSILNWIGKLIHFLFNIKLKNFYLDFLGSFFFFFTHILYDVFNYTGYYSMFDLLSTIRVARMFKLINLHPRLRVITTALSSSSPLLILSIYFCLMAIMICGSSLYYIERLSDPMDSQIISVIDGMWLAITTICTVGYGDIVPVSLGGMILGAITTIIGVLIIDLPMPIINSIFDNYNRHLLARQQLPKQRRRITPAVIPRKIQPLMSQKRHSHAHQT